MTCIVAISDDGIVYMAGERGVSDNYLILSSTRPKISEHGLYLFGYAGNIGIGQLVENSFPFPAISKTHTVEKHMYKVFMPALRTFLKDHDIKAGDNEENSSDFIIGIKGHIYEVSTHDLYAVEYEQTAIGSGSQYAIGYLHATQFLPPEERVVNAVHTSIIYSPSCQGPVDILSK